MGRNNSNVIEGKYTILLKCLDETKQAYNLNGLTTRGRVCVFNYIAKAGKGLFKKKDVIEAYKEHYKNGVLNQSDKHKDVEMFCYFEWDSTDENKLYFNVFIRNEKKC